jgi:hypothetical protein
MILEQNFTGALHTKPYSSVGDPCHFGTDPDPRKFFKLFLFITYFLKLHLHHFSNIKSSDRRSIPRTTKSGSGRPKNIGTDPMNPDPDPQHYDTVQYCT